MASRPGEMSRRITEGREAAGLGRREAARRLGVKVRHLWAWERGGAGIPRAVRTDMAALYGLPVSDLVPARAVAVSDRAGTITIGSVSFSLQGATDDSLRGFLATVRSQRSLAAGADLPIRGSDAVVLAGVLGDTPDAITARIGELLGVSEVEAQDMGAWIWRRRLLASGAAAGVVASALTAGAVLSDPEAPPGGSRSALEAAAESGVATQVLAIARTSPVREPAALPPDGPVVIQEAPEQEHRAGPREDRHDPHLAQIAALQARLAEQDALLASQAAQLAVQKVHLESQEAQIASLRGQLSDDELMIADLTKQNIAQSAKLTEQSAVIKGLNGELVNQGSIIAELNTQLAAQAATIAELKEEAENAEAKLVEAHAEYAAAVDALKKEIAAIKSEGAIAQAQAASSIAAQANLIDALKQEAITAKAQVDVATAELQVTARQLAEAQEHAEAAQRQAAEAIAKLEAEITRLQSEIAALQGRDGKDGKDGKGPGGHGGHGG